MTENPQFRLRYVGGVAVVAVGEHGAGEPLGPEGLFALVERERGRLVIDLPSEHPLSSAVLGKLVTLHRKAKGARAGFRLCCPAGPTLDVLRITRLDRIIPTFPTLADALRGV
jgi:anti-sigma B factor antagonist